MQRQNLLAKVYKISNIKTSLYHFSIYRHLIINIKKKKETEINFQKQKEREYMENENQ